MSKRPRTRGASSSSSGRAPTFDSFRFCSEKAEKRYEELKDKKFTQERSLRFNTGEIRRGAITYRLGDYISTVEKLGWEGFATPLEAFSAQLVFEFYANLLESVAASVDIGLTTLGQPSMSIISWRIERKRLSLMSMT